ncbi:hypothetical protein DNK59_15245 [Pseudomonas sp. TKO26]|uniref:hypothetical protein n=1 Tax=Pseudomonas TaxID=286 RepID=UPI000D87F9D9|nr:MULTISPECIES: hypothetical protein [Pseudomonas]PYY85453.1 hypothetical protein DNK62_15245 [Pseudomonas sp. TKO30]PYY87636.1 hypothetical protein DNK61_15240 [Pseudomonas sp. TKO29]PYY90360.1 hypothetical protein DNK59_15245 [Pseudomonas sp. TKO26]PYY99544.1 hypothetical protein DNK60_15240 [Pseudomonas sp. TKO14]
MYRRLLLVALLGLSLGACVPYYDGGSSYYSSEVYSTPAPAYYYGGGASYYSTGRSYYAPRYYQPAPRYYSPAPRYYQVPRAVYRPYPAQGWGGHERHGNWNNDNGGDQDWGGHGGRGRGDHGRGGRGH